MKKFLNGTFIVLFAAIVLALLGKALIMPEEINEYENRYSEQLTLPTFKTFWSGEFQDATEKALADQVLFSTYAKQLYNGSFSYFNQYILDTVKSYTTAEEPIEDEPIIEEFKTIADPDARYYTLPSGRQMLLGHLMFETRFLDNEKGDIDHRLSNINSVIEQYPDIDFYLYYIEKETDINFVTGERSNIFEYIRDNVALTSEHVNRFNVTNFEDFDKWFYITDHHLNYKGARECYTQLLAWMLPEEKALRPTGQYQVGYYSGSKATGKDAENYKDINTCYTYNYPEMKTKENGKKIGYYGAQEYYIAKVEKNDGELLPKVTYGQLFGQDSGEIIFETPSKENGSILLFGESMDNSILRLFASHYSKLYSIDIRNYPKQMDKKFNLKKYLKSHPDIDKIMFIGNLDYFTQKQFDIK